MLLSIYRKKKEKSNNHSNKMYNYFYYYDQSFSPKKLAQFQFLLTLHGIIYLLHNNNRNTDSSYLQEGQDIQHRNRVLYQLINTKSSLQRLGLKQKQKKEKCYCVWSSPKISHLLPAGSKKAEEGGTCSWYSDHFLRLLLDEDLGDTLLLMKKHTNEIYNPTYRRASS